MEKDDPMRSNGRLGRKALFSLAAHDDKVANRRARYGESLEGDAE